MQYQRLTGNQKAVRSARLWIYSKASQLQADRGYSRAEALKIAGKMLQRGIEKRQNGRR